jgi:hypothetical protein
VPVAEARPVRVVVRGGRGAAVALDGGLEPTVVAAAKGRG